MQRPKTPMPVHYAVRHVRQRTGTSCGVACIAMLADVSGTAARRILASSLEDYDSDVTDVPDLRAALRRFGIHLGRKVPTRTWRDANRLREPGLAAVRFKRNRTGTERWHWVVVEPRRDGPIVWDPLRRKGMRRDTENLPLAWFHHVRRKRRGLARSQH